MILEKWLQLRFCIQTVSNLRRCKNGDNSSISISGLSARVNDNKATTHSLPIKGETKQRKKKNRITFLVRVSTDSNTDTHEYFTLLGPLHSLRINVFHFLHLFKVEIPRLDHYSTGLLPQSWCRCLLKLDIQGFVVFFSSCL